jgi:uroporphyrinogen-III decarboxylase
MATRAVLVARTLCRPGPRPEGLGRKDIDKLFDWHRKTQLKDYVEILQTAQKQLQGNITQADLLADYDEIKHRTETLLLKAAPDLADLAAQPAGPDRADGAQVQVEQ